MGFLVLSRRLNERILIGDNIELLIADIRQTKEGEFIVDIALNAPKSVKILKKETHLKDIENNGIAVRNKSRPGHKRARRFF